MDTGDQPIATEGELIFGRVLDGKGGGRPIGWDEARDWQPAQPGEVLWLHLRRYAPGIAGWLAEGLRIPEPTVELLTSDTTRPRAFRENGNLVATLRGINFNPGAEPEDMVSMQLWSDGARVLTLRRRASQTPRDVVAEIDAGQGPIDAGALVTSLIRHMIERMNQSIVDMNETIDQLEELDLDTDADAMLGEIARLRRNCLALKRHMAPQHDALEGIVQDAPEWFEQHDRRAIAETIDRLRRYIDDVAISQESALVLQDDIRARAAAHSQKTSYLLSVVATIFMPLTFLTGLLGSNVAGIPGADRGYAFWAVVALCGAIFILQLLLFRKWKWL